MRPSRARAEPIRPTAAESGASALWLPVPMGVGIAVYFALPWEPPWWLGAAGAGAALVLLAALGWRSRYRPLPVALLAVAVGFAAISHRTAGIDARPLDKPTHPVPVTGTVAGIEPGPVRARVILADLTVARLGASRTPAKARLTLVEPDGGLAVGDRIRVLAALRPPPPPIMPGAYDFQRQAFFDGLGAYGYALGPPETMERAADSLHIGDIRRAITARVLAEAPGAPAAAVAAALLSGHRGHIGDDTLQDLRDAGIAHLLAISGLHIGLIAGLVFAAARLGIALTPRLGTRIDGKKIAAVLAMAGASVYAVLAGFPVPTERALIMTGLVLIGVLIDRRTLSLRTVALAASAILLTAPESLVQPGFQMSFAAVTALIAVHAEIRARRRRNGDAGPKGPVRRALGYVGGVMLMTLVASAATAPFAVYHFQHVSTFGLIANLVAVPLAAFWIMPAGLAAMLGMPFGLDAPFVHLMIAGTRIMLAVAHTVAAWPGTSADIAAPPTWGIACVALGGLGLALMKTRLRLAGVPVLILGYAAPFTATPPDIVVDGAARVVAVKGEEGTLMLSSSRRARFETAGWRRRAGERADADWPEDPEHPLSGLRCDAHGCQLRRNGIKVGIAIDGLSLDDDCRLSDLIVALEPLPRYCRPPMGRIDRFDLWRGGTHAIWLTPDGSVRAVSVNGERGSRPWTGRPAETRQ